MIVSIAGRRAGRGALGMAAVCALAVVGISGAAERVATGSTPDEDGAAAIASALIEERAQFSATHSRSNAAHFIGAMHSIGATRSAEADAASAGDSGEIAGDSRSFESNATHSENSTQR